jgi:probable HAF family extracellular repeat protein
MNAKATAGKLLAISALLALPVPCGAVSPLMTQESDALPQSQAFAQAAAAGKLKIHTSRRPEAASPHSEPQALPHWSGSFKFTIGTGAAKETQTYSYTMIGTDPSKGSAMTTVRTIIVPLRLQIACGYDPSFNFSCPLGGVTLDASTDTVAPLNQSVVNNVLASPSFTPSPVYAGGTYLGTTQYADAVQRGNLWDIVSNKARDYHIVLKPEVYATQTVAVPPGSGFFYPDFFTGNTDAILIADFSASDVLDAAVNRIVMQINDPSALVIVMAHNVAGCDNFSCFNGYHDALTDPASGRKWTHIFTTYNDAGSFGGGVDIDTLSHEISEWLNDPFVDNVVPGWGLVGGVTDGCASGDLLEVGDPVDGADLNYVAGGLTWHPQDIVFLPWFEYASTSTSVNGWYTFNNATPSPNQPCSGPGDDAYTTLDFPHAYRTRAFGVNNLTTVVGYYTNRDANFNLTFHGFIYQNGGFTSLDVPGAIATFARAINDGGQIVGDFSDSSNNTHGFLYSRGAFQVLDVPGSVSTVALGISFNGEIVGDWTENNGKIHSVEWSGGTYNSFIPSFAFESGIFGISGSGQKIVGGYDTGDVLLTYAYQGSKGSLAPFTLPLAVAGSDSQTFANGVNDQGDMVGYFNEHGGDFCGEFFCFPNGFVWSGKKQTWVNLIPPDATYVQPVGINDGGIIVGILRDRNGNGIHGVILNPQGQ